MASPFIPRLGTNYCPTDEEVLQIEALLVEPTLRSKCLNDEIADLQERIDKLAEERNGLEAYLEAHKALISPVRRLSLDIIREIFVACLPTDRNCIMSASEPPVLLGRICSSWRAISLSTPRLWAKLHVVRPTRPPPDSFGAESFEKKHAQRLETMKAWISRSGDCPLSISLDGGLDFVDGLPTPPDTAYHSRLFVQALIPFAFRWREMKFKAQAPVLLEALSNLTERDVPILQDLTICELLEPLGSRSRSPSQSWSQVGVLRGHRLSKLSLLAGRLSPVELPLRWSQLTFLSMEDLVWNSRLLLTSGRALQILSQCPELLYCHLGIHDHDRNAENPIVGSIVECPFLNSMSLVCRALSASTLQQMFSRLSLPELRHLKLRGFLDYEADEFDGVPSVSSFLAVSTRLESLDISTDAFSKASLMHLLHRLPPTMQRLKIVCAFASPGTLDALDDDVLAILTPSADLPSPRCPLLRKLDLWNCTTVSDAALLRLITARMSSASCSSLERVEVRFSRNMHFDILPGLERFTAAGLHIALEYPPPTYSCYSPWIGLEDHSESE